MRIQIRSSSLPAMLPVGAAVIAGTFVVLVDSSALSPLLPLLIPVALVTAYLMLRYPVSLVVVLFVMWCTAPAFEWIELGSIAGFSIRPDYVAIVLMVVVMLLAPHARRTSMPASPLLRMAIVALVLAELISMMIGATVSGDLHITLLLGLKTIGAGASYFFLRSRLSRRQLAGALGLFIGLAIIPIAVSVAVGITHSSDLFDLLLKGAGTQAAFNTPFGTVPRAFLLGAEPYMLAVFALCLTFALGTGVAPRIRFLAAVMILMLVLRLPFTWARGLIATYAMIFVSAIAVSWWAPWMRISRKARLIQIGSAAILMVVSLLIVQSAPELQAAFDFTTKRLIAIPADLDPQASGARYVGASLALDALSDDPIALMFGFGTRVEFIGFSAIPTGDIATPAGIWFKFGLIGLVAVLCASVAAFQACWRGLKGNILTQLLANSILLTLTGFWFQTIVTASPFASKSYATILVLGVLFVFLELSASSNRDDMRQTTLRGRVPRTHSPSPRVEVER